MKLHEYIIEVRRAAYKLEEYLENENRDARHASIASGEISEAEVIRREEEIKERIQGLYDGVKEVVEAYREFNITMNPQDNPADQLEEVLRVCDRVIGRYDGLVGVGISLKQGTDRALKGLNY